MGGQAVLCEGVGGGFTIQLRVTIPPPHGQVDARNKELMDVYHLPLSPLCFTVFERDVVF